MASFAVLACAAWGCVAPPAPVQDVRDEPPGRVLSEDGGQPAVAVVPFRDHVYAGVDEPRAGRSRPEARILRNEDDGWRVDAAFGPEYGRIEALAVLTLGTDGSGRPLRAPVELLAAGPRDTRRGARPATVWTREDATGAWVASVVADARPEAAVEALVVHRDRVTGVDHVFAVVSGGAIHRGAYDPHAPGRLRWDPEPELAGAAGVASFVERGDALHVVQGEGLLRRVDGPQPRWEPVGPARRPRPPLPSAAN